MHGYQRNTTDVDIIINAGDTAIVKELLSIESFCWDEEAREFRSPSGVPVQFLISGEKAGKGSEVNIPEPAGETNVEILGGLSRRSLVAFDRDEAGKWSG
ncbi:MAG: hypothetical protein JNL67_08945 [Planctomycetaceae bacterium]|nr:hypothetical protein [Planctomycetaceae bacterium]